MGKIEKKLKNLKSRAIWSTGLPDPVDRIFQRLSAVALATGVAAPVIGKQRKIFLFGLCKDWGLGRFDLWPSWLYKDIENWSWASRKTYNWRENQEEEKIKPTSSRFLHFSLQLSACLFLLPFFLVSFYYSWCIFLQLY